MRRADTKNEKKPMTEKTETTDQIPARKASLGAAICSGFWLTGWQRKYRTLDGRNDWTVAYVFRRLLDADDRYQRENNLGRYSLPNVAARHECGAQRNTHCLRRLVRLF